LFSGFHDPTPGSNEQHWNGAMSSARIIVEWGLAMFCDSSAISTFGRR
jgi:hypothetical protein